MNFWKRSIIFLSAIAMLVSVVGCGANEEPPTDEVADDIQVSGEDSIEEQDEDGKVIIRDHLGREVVFEEEVNRIVSGYYITTSMLIPLGLKDNVVGIEAKAESRNIYGLAAPEFLDLPNVGTAKEFDLEGCAALDPDLVILPIRLKEAVESLEELGIKVIAVNPEDMDLLKETLKMIGKVTGSEDKADDLISYYEEKTLEVEKIAKNGEEKKVYISGNSDFLSTATAKMYQNYIIETAGGINVAADIDDTYWATISYEQLLAYNPDIIIIAPSADYTKEDVLKDDKLTAISAIESGNVYAMPDKFEAWDSPIPSSILGTMWLTSILHEEAYSYDEFRKDAADFYSQFYGIEIDEDDIEK